VRPRLLDLFCGAGGCTKGYQRAGFYVVGIDNRPQPNYCGDEFYEMEALTFLGRWLAESRDDEVDDFAFDAIHASPPCQAYSSAGKAAMVTLGRTYPDLYHATRELLEASGLPWVIENVTAAPSRSGVILCGSMFGLPIQRHRTFESSELLLCPAHCAHQPDAITVTGNSPQRWLRGKRKSVPPAEYRAAMGIDWMLVRELVQAIPPAYTELIGQQLMQSVRAPVA
jgi:DNA (cytosine-5)-methyltransferase 1